MDFGVRSVFAFNIWKYNEKRNVCQGRFLVLAHERGALAPRFCANKSRKWNGTPRNLRISLFGTPSVCLRRFSFRGGCEVFGVDIPVSTDGVLFRTVSIWLRQRIPVSGATFQQLTKVGRAEHFETGAILQEDILHANTLRLNSGRRTC
jgi:hypothetical protein